jgi:4-amino-4-deoxy-L-arabinose transferase-like glycosyltransferase
MTYKNYFSAKRLFLPVIILLLGAALRFHALAYDARFHPDEALFATFARKAAVNGDWLLHGPLDKPPLAIFADAVSMMLVGVRSLPNGVLTLDVHAGEFAARVPGTLASILLIAVIYALAKALYRRDTIHRVRTTPNTPLIALLLFALSPYALAFSATVFTDGLMLLCVVIALWMGTRGRWFWAGLWLALGFACKQQAFFYLPLVIGVAWIVNNGTKRALSLSALIRLLLPITLSVVLLSAWDTSRAEETGMWALAAENNDPGGFVRADELVPRLLSWGGYIGHFIGIAWLTSIFITLAFAALASRLTQKPREKTVYIDLILLFYSLAYIAFHWLVAFPTHDRYPLLILPLIVLLVARGINWAWNGLIQRVSGTQQQSLTNFSVALLLCFSVLCFFPSALDAVNRQISIGGDHGEYAGIGELGAYLDAKPLGTIVYDHWLGWELGYYLGTWSDKRLTYYPDAASLAETARLQPDPAPRYFVAPIDTPVEDWLQALREAGFQVIPDFQTERQIVYRLTRNDG